MATVSKAELVKEVRDKIEFTIVIAIFFSSFLYMAMKAGGSNDLLSNSIGVLWGVAVAIHILNYLLIDASGKEIKIGWFKWVRRALAFGIFIFVPTIFIAAIYHNKTMPIAWSWIYLISLGLTLAMPVLIFLLICGHLDWMAVKDMWKMARKKLMKR